MRLPALLLVVACGRSGFDPDSRDDGHVIDMGPSGPHLLLDYEFESDGVFHDRSAGHHDAVCTMCPTVDNSGIAPRSSVIDLPGTTGTCFAVLDAPDLQPPKFTWSVWVWRMQNTGGTILSQAVSPSSTADTFLLGSSINDTVWELAMQPQHILTKIDPMIWTHVVVTYDGSITQVFLGTPGSAPPVPTRMVAGAALFPLVYTGQATWFGCNLDNNLPTGMFTGQLDGIQLYDDVLSMDQIRQLSGF